MTTPLSNHGKNESQELEELMSKVLVSRIIWFKELDLMLLCKEIGQTGPWERCAIWCKSEPTKTRLHGPEVCVLYADTQCEQARIDDKSRN
ncbi:hypothetical protein VNO77_05638 [Canavalia gladiata]|uniref:Uncharacterized protein n=1 Tax=Canavalia gladiata TaxID=3824 RepID=A0AAN9MYR3_CANGL